jgi:hypothetical protein
MAKKARKNAEKISLPTGRIASQLLERLFRKYPGLPQDDLIGLILFFADPLEGIIKYLALEALAKVNLFTFDEVNFSAVVRANTPGEKAFHLKKVLEIGWQTFSSVEQEFLLATGLNQVKARNFLSPQQVAKSIVDYRKQRALDKVNKALELVASPKAAASAKDGERTRLAAEAAALAEQLSSLLRDESAEAEESRLKAVMKIKEQLDGALAAYQALFDQPASPKELEEPPQKRSPCIRALAVFSEDGVTKIGGLRRFSQLSINETKDGLLEAKFKLGGYRPGKTDPRGEGSSVRVTLYPQDVGLVENLLQMEDVTVKLTVTAWKGAGNDAPPLLIDCQVIPEPSTT